MSGDSVLLYGIKESWNGRDVRIALSHLNPFNEKLGGDNSNIASFSPLQIGDDPI